MRTYFLWIVITIQMGCLYAQNSDNLSSLNFNQLDSLIKSSLKNKDYSDGVLYAQEALKKAQSNSSSIDSLQSYYTGILALCYDYNGQSKQAEQGYQQAITLTKQVLGIKHPMTTSWMNNLAFLYKSQQMFEKAEPLYLEVLSIRTEILGTKHPLYARSLNNLGTLYFRMKKFPEAGEKLLAALQIRKESLGLYHKDYLESLENVAIFHEHIGKIKEAENFYVKTLDCIVDKESLQYAKRLTQIGKFYWRVGQYQTSKDYLVQALNIEKIHSSQNLSYAMSLNNTGVILLELGEFVEAEQLLLKSKKIRSSIYGTNHKRIAETATNLGLLYKIMGREEEALNNYQEARSIWIALGDTLSKNYATLLNNLAAIFEEKQDYKNALQFIQIASNIRKELFGTHHLAYAQSLSILGKTYNSLKEFQKADSVLLQALRIVEELTGKEHPQYISLLSSLGNFYVETHQYKKALEVFTEAKNISSSVVGDQHPDYVLALNNLAVFLQKTGDYQKAYPLSLQVSQTVIQNIQETYPYLSEKQRLQFLDTNIPYIYGLYRLATQLKHPKVIQGIQDVSLATKGLALSRSNLIGKIVNTKGDSSIIGTYNNWLQSRKQLAQSIYLSKEEINQLNIDSLKLTASEQEKQLAQKSSNIGRRLYLQQNYNTKHLKQSLKDKEASIDFIHFPLHYDNQDSVLYFALIMTNETETPILVQLAIEKDFQKILRLKVSNNGLSYISDKEISNQLYSIVWKPLTPYLKEIEHIHISVSGVLHKIAFEALYQSLENKYLLEQYNIHYYNTLRDFIHKRKSTKNNTSKSILLFGGANFNLDSLTLVNLGQNITTKKHNQISNSYPKLNQYPFKELNTRTENFTNLKGSLKEVEDLTTLFWKKNWKVESFTKDNALEDQLLLSIKKQCPTILHLATHGYFFPKPQNATQLSKDIWLKDRLYYHPNPLFRSGLAFAGANYVWQGNTPIQNMEDGILTAYEVVALNLSKTNLVVLSACESSKGDIDNHEGVFGLQRAFKIAGTQNLISSLWKVDDQATAIFMNYFYKIYLSGTPISKALMQAKFYIKNYTIKGYKPFNSPFYWASFILIE